MSFTCFSRLTWHRLKTDLPTYMQEQQCWHLWKRIWAKIIIVIMSNLLEVSSKFFISNVCFFHIYVEYTYLYVSDHLFVLFFFLVSMFLSLSKPRTDIFHMDSSLWWFIKYRHISLRWLYYIITEKQNLHPLIILHSNVSISTYCTLD